MVGTRVSMQNGRYAIVSVRIPGAYPQRVGIILVDHLDRAYIKLSDSLLTVEPDVLEVWANLLDSLTESSRDIGGIALLQLLDDIGSNFLEVGPIESCAISNPEAQVTSLYDEFVVANVSQSPDASGKLSVSRLFTDAAIHHARLALPSAPASCLELVHTFRSGNLSIDRLRTFVDRDPGIAAQIIRLANLAAYSYSYGQIRSTQQALIQVGTSAAVGFLLGLILKPLYSSPLLRQVWDYSLRRRAAAARLASAARLADPEEQALIALVADLGQVVLLNMDGYSAHYEQLRTAGHSPLSCERALCGRTHADVSADLLADWSFPQDMVQAVRYHHSPSQIRSEGASCTYLAECTLESPEVECDLDEFAAARAQLCFSDKMLATIREPKPDESSYTDLLR